MCVKPKIGIIIIYILGVVRHVSCVKPQIDIFIIYILGVVRHVSTSPVPRGSFSLPLYGPLTFNPCSTITDHIPDKMLQRPFKNSSATFGAHRNFPTYWLFTSIVTQLTRSRAEET